MPGASGLYVDHGGQRYEIVPTQVTCYGAVTVLSHIRGEAFKRAYGREAPPDVVRTLEAKAAEEAAAAKATKQKKLAVLGARKGERELAEYKAHRAKLQERGVAGRCLYFASADSEGVLRFDCSACGRFVPAQAFRGHVTLAEHARALANAGLSEDYAFHAKQREACLDAERQSSQHCEVCDKWITKGNWDDHCAGRAHLQREAAAGSAAPATDALPRASSSAETEVLQEAPLDTARPAPAASAAAEIPEASSSVSAALPSPSLSPCTRRLSPGEVSADSGPGVLKEFAGDTVDLFVCGEDAWRLPPELCGGAGAAAEGGVGESGVVRGLRCVVSMPDEVRWGCPAAPGRVPTLVRDEDGAGAAGAPGVRHTVAKEALAICCATLKKGHRLRLACFERRVGSGRMAVVAFFMMEREPKMTEDQVASMVAKAHGGEGTNYALLCLMLHEYKRRGWVDGALERLKKNVEARVVGWK